MVKIVVLGAGGRMGCRIVALLHGIDDMELTGAVEAKGHPSLGADAGLTAGIPKLGVSITDRLSSVLTNADVIIDFTTPDCTMSQIDLIEQQRKPTVIGTTGFIPDQIGRIQTASRSLPCVISPNMSIGVNVMFRVVADLATLLGEEYDLEIIETHHRFKKDAPSGTAVRLAEILAQAAGRNLGEVAQYTRHGLTGERKKGEIGIQAIRAGDVVGEHTVIFGGLGERIEITHRAHSRDNFARGALLAARWIVKQPPGLYRMSDVLGLPS